MHRFIREVGKQPVDAGIVVQQVIQLVDITDIRRQPIGAHGVRVHHHLIQMRFFNHVGDAHVAALCPSAISMW